MARSTDPLTEFNQARWGGSLVSPLEPRLRKLSRWIHLQPAGNLLDIGCGDGGFSCQFIPKGWQVSGIDLTAEQVEQARAKKVQAVQGDASQKLPFPDQSFTAVVASEVIEHLVDTDRFLEEIWRVLKPGGSLYLTTANLASLNNRIRLALGWYPTVMDYSCREGVGHVRYYTLKTLLRQLVCRGFTVQRSTGSYVPLIPTRWTFRSGLPRLLFPFSFAIGDLLPECGMELVVHAQRAE